MTTGLRTPFGIELDVTEGKMYWTEYTHDKIQRAELDGSGVVRVLTSRFLCVPTLYFAP